jgi:uncharacterized membrane protein YtjA (UPF0391 family)
MTLFAEIKRSAIRQIKPAPCAMMYRRRSMLRLSDSPALQGEDVMLKWALIFFIISLVAGLFGFTGIASGAAAVAKILFYIAVALFLLFLVLGLMAVKAVK